MAQRSFSQDQLIEHRGRHRPVQDLYVHSEKGPPGGSGVTVWPEILKEMCRQKNIPILD